MSNIIPLPISAMLRRLRKAKHVAMFPTMFEPRPVQVKKTVRKETRPPPPMPPTFSEGTLVIDSDGSRHPPAAHIEMVAALVLEELLRKHEGVKIRRTPCGITLWWVRTDRPMTDRLIAMAIRQTPSIIFCKHGRRHMGGRYYGPPVWLANAVRFAVFDRPNNRRKNATK